MSIDDAITLLRERAQSDRDVARIWSGDGQFASFMADRASKMAEAVDVVVAALGKDAA